MYYTFNRCDKRTFDAAFAAGTPVTMVKDPSYANAVGSSFITRGFTRETVADPYADGPSRAGERWFYWVADVATATPVGPLEFVPARGDGSLDGWGFRCDCGDRQTSSLRGMAERLRDGHAAWHVSREVAA